MYWEITIVFREIMLCNDRSVQASPMSQFRTSCSESTEIRPANYSIRDKNLLCKVSDMHKRLPLTLYSLLPPPNVGYGIDPFTPKFKNYILPNLLKEKCVSQAVRIGSIIIVYPGKL